MLQQQGGGVAAAAAVPQVQQGSQVNNVPVQEEGGNSDTQ